MTGEVVAPIGDELVDERIDDERIDDERIEISRILEPTWFLLPHSQQHFPRIIIKYAALKSNTSTAKILHHNDDSHRSDDVEKNNPHQSMNAKSNRLVIS